MKKDNTMTSGEATNETNARSTGMRKSSLLLIGTGVIVFGLIIGDRVLDMVRVDDLPDAATDSARLSSVQVSTAVEDEQPLNVSDAAENAVSGTNAADDNDTVAATIAEVSDVEIATDTPAEELISGGTIDKPQNIEDVFGTRLTFVSRSEPAYVITANDQRIDLGDNVDEDTILTGLTGESVIVNKNGELVVLQLPAPGE